MSNKQTSEGGGKEGGVVGRSRRGGGRHQRQQQSLSLLPADLVPVFCHRDPLLLGLVIRLWQRSRKDKQSLHQLHQEPWPHTEHLSFRLGVPPSVLWPPHCLPTNQRHACTEPPFREEQ